MGQVETKVFENQAPPWDVAEICEATELTREDVSLCWAQWRSSPLSKNGSLTYKQFLQTCNIDEKSSEDCRNAKKLFEILDTDRDHKVEFPDLMIFLFCLSDNLTSDQVLKRSFLYYDRNRSGKVSKTEMMKVLLKLERIDEESSDDDDSSSGDDKPEIPPEVEYVFSLMNFDGNSNKVTLEEFLKSAGHYRKLRQMLSIQILDDKRTEFIRNLKANNVSSVE